MNERINDLNMTTFDTVLALSGGNPGAITVCMNILKNGKEIDPDNALEGLGPLLMLDTLNIWDSRIWMLYKDVCGKDLTRMLAVLRAYQLGKLNGENIVNAIDRGSFIDLDNVLTEVQSELPKFGVSKV